MDQAFEMEPGDSRGFTVAHRFQDPDYGLPPSQLHKYENMEEEDLKREQVDELFAAKQTRMQLEQFLETKRASGPIARIATGSPYRPFAHDLEIRVFEVFPDRMNAPIKGFLHHVSVEFQYQLVKLPYGQFMRGKNTNFAISLNERRPVCYTALSYVWGPADDERTVLIDGHLGIITARLETAIRHLRHDQHSITLWIDQVCINQNDISDKEHQIQLMGLIYQRAWNTVIWLGDQPARGAFRALQGLHEATQYRDDDLLEEEREYLRHPLNEDPEVYSALVEMMDRPWFKRTWTIQEVVLSQAPYVMTGSSTCYWDDFAGYCVGIRKIGVLDIEDTPNPAGGEIAAPRIQGVEVAAQLFLTRSYFSGHAQKSDLLPTLIETRYAQVSNPLDKIYGVLALCENDLVPSYNKTPAELFTEVANKIVGEELASMAAIRDNKMLHPEYSYHYRLYKLLECVDHEQIDPSLPSWVPDWSRPRVTTPLVPSSSSLQWCHTGGIIRETVAQVRGDGRRLCIRAKLFDSIGQLSDILIDGTMSVDSPREGNRGLQKAITFAKTSKSTGTSTEGDFITFCKTIVAGKDGPGLKEYPDEYTEILSLLCDSSSIEGTTPTFHDQTYSTRQRQGHFTLGSLRRRAVGRTFQNLRRAYKAAAVNRRLCRTEQGYLGLVPRYARKGDWVAVFPGCSMPFIIRESVIGNSDYALVGEAYVHEILDGRVMDMADLPLREIGLV